MKTKLHAKNQETTQPLSILVNTKNTLLLLLALEGLLENTDHLTQSAEQRSEAKGPALDAHGVDEEVDESPVGDDEDAEDSEISPCIAGLDVESGEVAVGEAVRAVLTVGGGLRVEEVAASGVCEGASVGLAGLTSRHVEHGGLT